MPFRGDICQHFNASMFRHYFRKKYKRSETFAKRVGTSRQAVDAWRTGKSNPTWRHLIKIAEVLKIAPRLLIMPSQRHILDRWEDHLIDYLEAPPEVKEQLKKEITIGDGEGNSEKQSETKTKRKLKLTANEAIALTEKLGIFDESKSENPLADIEPEAPDMNPMSWDLFRNPDYHAFNSDTAKAILSCVYNENNAKIVMSGPTRTGKTLLGLDIILRLMFEVPGFQALALRTDAVDLRETVRKSIKELCKYDLDHPNSPFIVKGGLDDFHKLVLPNGSALVLGGLNRPGRVLGTAYDAIFVSQVEMTDNDQFRKLMTRISSPAGNWRDESGNTKYLFIADANADRLDHYLIEEKENGTIHWFEFQFEDNPKFFRGGNRTSQWREVDELEQNLIHSRVHYDRYFLGKWGNPEGAVFIINEKNIIQHKDVPPLNECKLYRAQDYGSDHPSVNLWIAVHKETENRYVYREWRLTHTDIDIMSDEVKAYTGDETVENTIIEIDENRQMLMRKRGIPSVMARKGPGSVIDGIYLMNAALRKAQEGRNGGLYIVEGLKCNQDPNPDVDPDMDFIKEMRNIIFSDNRDAPVKKDDDATDAYRYFELWFNSQLEDPIVYVGSIKQKTGDLLVI